MCDDWRFVKSQRMVEDAKKAQEYQMKEQENIKKQEQEVDRLWLDVSKKEYEESVRESLVYKHQR
jgi:predicted small secreted protein